MTMRGGDRPKHAHLEFPQVSVMPSPCGNHGCCFASPCKDELRTTYASGAREAFGAPPVSDLLAMSSSRHRLDQRSGASRRIQASSLRRFLRQVVCGVLPLGKGVVLDPFAGSGSTLAAAEAVGYESIGLEKDGEYFALAIDAIPKLAGLKIDGASLVHPGLPQFSNTCSMQCRGPCAELTSGIAAEIL